MVHKTVMIPATNMNFLKISVANPTKCIAMIPKVALLNPTFPQHQSTTLTLTHSHGARTFSSRSRQVAAAHGAGSEKKHLWSQIATDNRARLHATRHLGTGIVTFQRKKMVSAIIDFYKSTSQLFVAEPLVECRDCFGFWKTFIAVRNTELPLASLLQQ